MKLKKLKKPKKLAIIHLVGKIGFAKLPTMMAILDAVTPVVRITNRRPNKEVTTGKKLSDVVYFDAEYGDPITGTGGAWPKDILNAIWAAAIKLDTTITVEIIPGSIKHTIIGDAVKPSVKTTATEADEPSKKSKFFA